jgi:ribosome biogenesis GTPase
MHPFAYGGFVVDTPGLRDVGLWGLEPQEVGAAFVEFADHATGCRFDDCRHLREPGCAVVAAVERGEIARSRLDSYRRMLEETHVSARPWLQGRSR